MSDSTSTILDDPYTTDYEVGQDNLQMFGMDMHPVFVLSATLIFSVHHRNLVVPSRCQGNVGRRQNAWSINFDWLLYLVG
ncbi:MAG: hypothetical protein R3F37_23040 [Candidatus Competibacteraceae bacterium]